MEKRVHPGMLQIILRVENFWVMVEYVGVDVGVLVVLLCKSFSREAEMKERKKERK